MPIEFLLFMFLMLLIKRSPYFSLFETCWRQICGNFFRSFYQSFSGTWVFSAFWTSTNVEKHLFQANWLSSFNNSCLILKVFKLQVISNGQHVNKKVSHKNISSYPRITQQWKPRLRNLTDLSSGIEMYHFEGLL